MYHTTGFHADEIRDICEHLVERGWIAGYRGGRRPALGLYRSVVVTLQYLRRNHVQQELAEFHDVSQATISRTIARFTVLLGRLTMAATPTVEDLHPGEQLIVDGTLLPSWSWADHPEDWSGKHRTTGFNVQVACTLQGRLAWVSDPVPGKTHDANAVRQSGLLDTVVDLHHIGDKGYIGLGMTTPIRKPPSRGLLEWESQFNHDIGAIRYKIERTIANLKTWRIFHTDYRRPHDTFAQTISTVVGLEFHRQTF